MPWSEDKYPISMKNLTAEVRRKAVEIANALLADGMSEDRAIPIATAKAEEWAEKRDKPIKKKQPKAS